MNKDREEPQEIARVVPMGDRVYLEGPKKKTETGYIVEWGIYTQAVRNQNTKQINPS